MYVHIPPSPLSWKPSCITFEGKKHDLAVCTESKAILWHIIKLLSVVKKLLIRTQDLFHLYHSFLNIETEISFMSSFYPLGMPWSILKMESQDMPHPNGLCGLFLDFLWPWAFGTFFSDIFLPFFRSSPWVMVRRALGVVWAFSLITCRRGR